MHTTETNPYGLLESWLLALEAEGKSPKTVDAYRLGVVAMHQALPDVELDDITPDQLRRWLRDLATTRKPSTVATRHKGARLFLAWCVTEGELPASPMDKVPQPSVPDQHVPMLSDAQLRQLLDDCAGPYFTEVRDTALVMLLADTGCRLSEVANLQLDDVDLRDRVARVTGKGRRPRVVPIGARTARALDKYLRMRRRQAHAHAAWLWLSTTSGGRMTPSGVQQMLRRRGRRIGVKVHPHMLRHGFADAWLRAGGSEVDLMELAGWRSRQMVGRYAAANRSQRARDSHRRLSPMDRL